MTLRQIKYSYSDRLNALIVEATTEDQNHYPKFRISCQNNGNESITVKYVSKKCDRNLIETGCVIIRNEDGV